MAIAEPLIAIRGSGSRKLAHLTERAHKLCVNSTNKNDLTAVQYLKWTVMHSGSEMANLHIAAADIRQFSGYEDEVVNLLAHRAMGFTCMIQGKLENAYDEFEHFFQLFDYEKYAKSVSFQFSSMNDVSGSALAMATICLLRKQPELANQWRDKALAWALRSHNQVAICQSLVFSGGFIAGLQYHVDEMVEHMTQARHYVTKHQLSLWIPYIDLSMALSQLMLNDTEPKVTQLLQQASESMEVLLTQNGPYITVWALMYARACSMHKQHESGLNVLNRVQVRVQSGERWVEPELIRLHANFSYAMGLTDAETCLETLKAALALSNTQGSHLFVDAISQNIDAIGWDMASTVLACVK
jgi:hypothetical protein